MAFSEQLQALLSKSAAQVAFIAAERQEKAAVEQPRNLRIAPSASEAHEAKSLPLWGGCRPSSCWPSSCCPCVPREPAADTEIPALANLSAAGGLL